MNFGTITEAPCENVAPSSDPRCEDPAFRLQNPDICPIEPSLIIKPGLALACQLGSVRFKAFIVENGMETDVSADTIFTSSDITIALVGARSGNATGISAGVVSITASYQDKTARAEFNVLGCTGACDSTVAMMVLLDTSRSMSQAFGGAYSTKLAFAKTAASNFAATINTQKDFVGAMTFNAAGTTLLASPTQDAATVASDIAGAAQTQQLTTFRTALENAIAELNATSVDLRVLVLVSDGEDTTSQYNEGNNPLVPVDEFKAAGGVVICLGVRAHDKGFNLLEAIATGGFFINGYSSTAEAAIGYLKGLRGYICAGNCTPAGDEIVHQGTNNWANFINWDVVQGVVDILGNGFYDSLPDNGLYVDLRGSPVIGGNYDTPILRSKNTFALLASHTYRVALDIAGNQAVPRPADVVTVRVFTDTVVLLSQQIGIPDYTQPFQTFSFSFTAPADMAVRIEVSQSNDTGTDLSETQAGVLLGRVKFEDTTDIIVILNDDFDQENPTYIPPACGIGTIWHGGYSVGYNCYGEGCLDEPPPVQLSDPLPLPDIESGFTPPIVYDSTKTVCATCPAGQTGISDTTLVPNMTGDTTPSGVASADSLSDPNDGQAWRAFNNTDTDTVWASDQTNPPHWLQYQFAATTIITAYSITVLFPSNAPVSWQFQGSNDGATWDTLDTQSNINWYQYETKKFQTTNTNSYLYYRLYVTAQAIEGFVAIAELFLFGPYNGQVCKTASAQSMVSQSDADAQATAAALAAAQSELNCVPFYTSTQQYTAKCSHDVDIGSFGQDVTKSATRISLNSQTEADTAALAAAKAAAIAELVCTLSNNDQPIAIQDSASPPTVAAPYPSVKYISGMNGLVTKVTVSIVGLTHFFPVDVLMILRAPTGETCRILANCGNAPCTNVNLVFDDAAGGALSAAAPIIAGTYKPSGVGFTNLPAPGPQPPIGLTLAVFNGIVPNGSWSLWVADDSFGSDGSIDSWDLTITAA